MSYHFYNPNPQHLLVGDCVIRALSKALNKDWTDIYSDLCVKGLEMADMPSSNRVWGALLMDHGYHRIELPEFITVKEFARKNPKGTYLLGISGHVLTLIDGEYFDATDSGNMVPYYYWSKNVL